MRTVLGRVTFAFYAIVQCYAQVPNSEWGIKYLDNKNYVFENHVLATWQGQNHNASVEISITSPPSGGFSVQLVLPNSSQYKNFPFDAFDGPGGYGESHKVYNIALSSSSSQKFMLDSYCTGFFPVEPKGAFRFNLFLQGSKRAIFIKNLKKILNDKNGFISINIKSISGESIKTQFSATSLKDYIK